MGTAALILLSLFSGARPVMPSLLKKSNVSGREPVYMFPALCYAFSMAKRIQEQPHDIDILLEEYRMLYGLVQIRLEFLDRRIPLVGSMLTVLGASVPAIPPASATVILWMIPVAMVWLVRTSIAHACSFEDALRRIEQIETLINASAGKPLLLFQSSHPSRALSTGGRTSAEAITTVSSIAALFLLASILFASQTFQESPLQLVAYLAVSALTASYLVILVFRWRRYRYEQHTEHTRS